MLIGCISFNELKKGSKEKDGAKRKLTTYINDYKNGYSTFEIECISFDKDGKMYFDVNGKQNGEQLDKVVKVDSVN